MFINNKINNYDSIHNIYIYIDKHKAKTLDQVFNVCKQYVKINTMFENFKN